MRIDAATAERGALRSATGPSLFDDAGLVIVEALESLSEQFADQVMEYASAPEPGAVVVFVHSGVVRGKRVLEALRAAGAAEFRADAVTKPAQFMEFVAAEFSRSGMKPEGDAVKVLLDSVGLNVAELAAAVSQLRHDVGARITVKDVERYHGTGVNATGFAVADAAIAGDATTALALTRHALAAGTDPVPLVAALASKVRTLTKVGAARSRGIDPVREYGLAPWMVEKARGELRLWDAGRLAEAITQIARADAEVKGAARNPAYSLERAVVTVARMATST